MDLFGETSGLDENDASRYFGGAAAGGGDGWCVLINF